MSHVRRKHTYQQIPDFDGGRIVAYLDYGLSYRRIAACVVRNLMTICRMWNQWFREDNMERRAES